MAKTLYKIRFISGDKVYELYARHVYQGDLYGFVVIEDIVFGETTSVVVDPQEEKLKSEVEGVEKTLIPIPSRTLTRKVPFIAFQKSAIFPRSKSFTAFRLIDLMEFISSS